MDHSYSTERERLQKSDHCYFTVAKKTPQVVLRKAQLKEQAAQECVKSAVGQDHSYVRADHVVQPVDDENLAHAHLLLELFHYQRELRLPASVTMETSSDSILNPEGPRCYAETVEHKTLETQSQRQNDLDDLPCWIGCIQLDHTYDRQDPLSAANSTVDISARLPQQTDHAYNAHDYSVPVRNRPTDHVYDLQCSTSSEDESASDSLDCRSDAVGQLLHSFTNVTNDVHSVAIDEQQWDHAYNVRYGSGTSLSEASSCSSSISGHHLDHSYEGSTVQRPDSFEHKPDFSDAAGSAETSHNWDHAYVGRVSPMAATGGVRRSVNTSRWSSSDDIRVAAARTDACSEPVSLSLHHLIS